MEFRPLALPETDPWMEAARTGASWLADRLPLDRGDLAAAAARVRFDPALRGPLADALAAQAARCGASDASKAAIERLRDPQALVVVTGQQAGALIGPNYTLFKAAGAVARARAAETQLGRPVVPVFWVASEDHDIGEIDRVRLPVQGGGQHDFHLFSPVPAGRRPVGPLAAGPELHRLIDEIRASNTMPGAHREAVLDLLASLVEDHATVGGHFTAVMARLFAGTPLVFLDPMDPALRRLAAPMLSLALTEPDRVERAALAGAAALEAVGREVQMPWQPPETGVFAILDGERTMLEVRDGRLAPRGRAGDSAPVAVWAKRAQETPEMFSTAAHLRPILEASILPVLGVVLGPGELRYHAELRELYEAFDAVAPLVWARPRAVLVGGTTRRLLDKLPARVEDVLLDWPGRLRAALAERDTIGIGPAFERFEAALAGLHADLMSVLVPLGKDLQSLGERNLKKMADETAWLRGKAEQAHRQGNDTLVRQYRTLGEHLAPERVPQERHFTAIAFLAMYGLDLAERMAGAQGILQPGLLSVDVVDAAG